MPLAANGVCEVVWGSATKALSERFSLEVIAYFSKKFDSPCPLKCCQTPQKCPNTKQLRKLLTSGDVLIVWKLDRLGRSLRDLITLLDDLKKQGIKFKSLTEAIDTETPTGRAMWQMVGVLAELERSLIRERTKAGRAAAMGRGVKMGRKPKLSLPQVAHARKLIEGGESPAQVAHLLGVTRSTLYVALGTIR